MIHFGPLMLCIPTKTVFKLIPIFKKKIKQQYLLSFKRLGDVKHKINFGQPWNNKSTKRIKTKQHHSYF